MNFILLQQIARKSAEPSSFSGIQAKTMRPLILICTSDASFYLIFSHILNADGFDCVPAGEATQAAQIVAEHTVSAVLMNCEKGTFRSLEATNQVQDAAKLRSVPVIALLQAGDEALYLEFLKLRLEQIFVQPYPPERLLDLLHVVTGTETTSLASRFADMSFSSGKLQLFPQAHRVHYDGAEVELQPLQFRLLAVMMSEPGRIFSRDELISAAWSDNVHVEPRTVDVHIGRLRESLGKVAGRDLIRTVRSAGYGLDRS